MTWSDVVGLRVMGTKQGARFFPRADLGVTSRRRANGHSTQLRGQGPRAEVRAARRLPRSRRSAAREDVDRHDAGHARQLTRGFSPGPKPGRDGCSGLLGGSGQCAY